ncbi:hypothetical protein [Sinorhizobium meliloti]|uniref:hypothetical protein n=1 Tax=Rhizobium meliloti TaxID=382 RepID=UPI001F29BC35|nr:hypothetical protein [Sinorhizobium meliloti]
MTAFARFLGEKAERYIELRHSLGYSFSKQAGTLRAFVRYVERAQFDAPATRTMALDFVLSFGGAANSRATRHGVLSRFYEYLAVYDAQTETLERRVFPNRVEGSLAASLLPHHRAYGSVHGGSCSVV